MSRCIRHPLTPLVLVALAQVLGFVAIANRGVGDSETFQFVGGSLWLLAAVYWLHADAHRRQIVPCFDFAFLCVLFVPLSLLWYCLWSRGWRGVLMLMLVGSLWVVPYFVFGLSWVLFQGL